MNSDSHNNTPRQSVELRLAALLLGELAPEEAAPLREIVERDPELKKLHDRLAETIELIREAAASPVEAPTVASEPLKLSPERREKLLAQFKTVTPQVFSRPRRREWDWFIPLTATGVLMLLVAIALPNFTRARSSDQRNSILNNMRILEGAKEQWALENKKSPTDVVGIGDLTAYLKSGTIPNVAGEQYSAVTVSEPITVYAASASDKAAKSISELENLSHVAGDSRERSIRLAQPSTTATDRKGDQQRLLGRYKREEPTRIPASRVGRFGIALPNEGSEPGAEPGLNESRAFQLNSRKLPSQGTAVTGGGIGGGAIVKQVLKESVESNLARLNTSLGTPSDEMANLRAVRPDTDRGIALPVAGPVAQVDVLTAGQPIDQQLTVDLPGSGTLFREDATTAGERFYFNRLELDRNGILPDPSTDRETSFDTAVVTGSAMPLLADRAVRSIQAPEKSEKLGFWYGDGRSAGRDSAQVTNVVAANADAYLEASVARAGVGSKDSGFALGESAPVEPGPVSAAGVKVKLREGTEPAKSAHDSEARRDLENLERVRDALRDRLSQEAAEAVSPKPVAVEIVDVAEAKPANGPGLGEKVVSTLSGSVKRSARVAVGKDVSDINALGLERGAASYDPQFKQTEFEKIRSKTVLNKVIDQLKLNEEWAAKRGGKPLDSADAYELLRKKVDVRPVGDTSLLDISVKSDNPEEAARIANTIAEVYRDSRVEEARDFKRQEVAALKTQLVEQEQKIASLSEQVERSKPEAKSPAPGEDRATPRPVPAPIPQPEIQTVDNAFSTFSLNVSDVSFKLAAASLEKGQMPAPGSVRSEEFINAFDYRDPEPAAGAALGFAWERASYPFAHNRDLLRLSVKTAAQGRQAGRPLNLVLALDNSGSMERADRVRIVREALRVLAAQLKPADKLSVITFARTARLVVDGVPGNQATEVAERISALAPEGGTNLEDAMNLAYATAKRHYLAQGINRVVILTDGAANLGNVDPDTLKQSVEAHRKQGIALDCFGIGWEGYNDDLLEVLSRNGDGRYGFVNSPQEASTQFANQLAGALKVAASDVKVQVEFNPSRVTAYRQIGYAKHQLTKEQFRDNTVDAAEIGAAEAGSALYVIQVNPRGAGSICTVRVRYKVPGTADYREHSWEVPFAGNAAPLDHSSAPMRLAATASAFSEWLASSPFAAEVTTDRLIGYLSGVPDVFGEDPRPKKLEWMIRQAKSLTGK